MIMRIILGLLAIVVGTAGLRYNFALTNTFPRLEFFEALAVAMEFTRLFA